VGAHRDQPDQRDLLDRGPRAYGAGVRVPRGDLLGRVDLLGESVCLQAQRPVGLRQTRSYDEPQHGRQEQQNRGKQGRRPGVLAEHVGDVELGDVDPVLLRQLDDHPDQGGRRQPPPQ